MKLLFSGVTTPKGFKAAGINCGIKKDNKLDLALLYSTNLCQCAGVYTKNIVKGHSLVLASEYAKKGQAQVVFINSGNANACVGPKGIDDAKTITKLISNELNILPEHVLTGSTGVIGYRLPMAKIKKGIIKASKDLSFKGGANAASAIMTTDTYTKEFAVKLMIDDIEVFIGGMAKGSGMIMPNMATMIATLTTDANISHNLLQKALLTATNQSFNKISVDGDTSVCDMTVILANGQSKCQLIKDNTKEYNEFFNGLLEVCQQLSKMIARDGEGATKLIEINIKNAFTLNDAELAAKAIANSPLVKTAFFGEDANWGRLLTAAGYSGANFNPNETTIKIGSLILFDKGVAIPFSEIEASEILKRKDIFVTIDFGEGNYEDTVWTCDFSYDYVKINAHYRT
ncbi:MAG: bifunctional glutamate N-acetyltransferase/amino-acid acetyltransferase ArgJ [Clostridiales bacterium]|nr:bifunctional glutamate N-acetyltransferase/amino-acid acetyltransferase ArgJ [Clostridiales bacterium]